MSRFNINEFFERQERLLPIGKLTEDLERYQKFIPNFDTLNIPPIISPALQAALDSVTSMPKVGLGSEIEKIGNILNAYTLPKSLQLSIDQILSSPSTRLAMDISKSHNALSISAEFQRIVEQVSEMHKVVDLASHNHFSRHWEEVAKFTKTLGLNEIQSISQSLALKAEELNFDFSDVTRFQNSEVESVIDQFSDEGFMDDFLSSLKKVKNNEDFKAYGFPIIWSFVILWLSIYISSLLTVQEISEREVKKELKHNAHYYNADYSDSNFRVITRNGVRLRSQPKRVEETILFELPAFTGVTIIERLSGRSPWVRVSLMVDGIPLEGWVATRYLQRIR